MIVVDISQPSSLAGAKKWLDLLHANSTKVPVILLANKVDLFPSLPITEEDREIMNQWCQENKLSLSWFVVSAARDQGEGDSVKIKGVFDNFAKEVVRAGGMYPVCWFARHDSISYLQIWRWCGMKLTNTDGNQNITMCVQRHSKSKCAHGSWFVVGCRKRTKCAFPSNCSFL